MHAGAGDAVPSSLRVTAPGTPEYLPVDRADSTRQAFLMRVAASRSRTVRALAHAPTSGARGGSCGDGEAQGSPLTQTQGASYIQGMMRSPADLSSEPRAHAPATAGRGRSSLEHPRPLG